MTTPNLTDAERDARAEVLGTMFDGNNPIADYYSPNDGVWERQRAMCVAENEAELNRYRDAIRTERDTAWRTAIEGMRKPHDPLCMVNAPMGYVPEDMVECDCSVFGWNAALSALADRMGE